MPNISPRFTDTTKCSLYCNPCNASNPYNYLNAQSTGQGIDKANALFVYYIILLNISLDCAKCMKHTTVSRKQHIQRHQLDFDCVRDLENLL